MIIRQLYLLYFLFPGVRGGKKASRFSKIFIVLAFKIKSYRVQVQLTDFTRQLNLFDKKCT